MKTSYLISNRYKAVSGYVFVLSLLLFMLYGTLQNSLALPELTTFALVGTRDLLGEPVYFGFLKTDITDEIIMLILVLSGLAYGFSKEKHEDELVAALRLNSLAWATIANYSILLFCYLFIYGLPFLNVLVIAMFSQLLIFIVLFRYRMHTFYKSNNEE